VSTRSRRADIAIFTALVMVMAPSVEAQETSLETVLAHAAAYVAEFQRQLSGIVAEESYTQDAATPLMAAGSPFRRELDSHRELKSDLLLVRPVGTSQYVEFRDVFEVDGKPVRDRQERLTTLFLEGTSSATQQIEQIIGESARYNIGNIQRTINTPVFPLLFLDRIVQPKFRFKRGTDSPPVMARGRTQNFSVGTEVWVIDYQEVDRNTMIRTTGGHDLPSRGRFWIEPDTGRVLMSELIVGDSLVRAVVDVSYQSQALLGFLVPVEMRERYEGLTDGSHVEGTATYGRFRQFQVEVDEKIPAVTSP
jgi:hypothetical protein